MRSGIIIFEARYGRLTHNTDRFGTMNPYVIVILGDQKVKTEPAKHMHLTPRWTTQLNLNYRNETHMQILVKSKEFFKDGTIGTGTIDLTKWQQKGIQKYSEWVPLFYKQVQAGAILVEMYFQRDQALGPMEEVIQRETIPNLNSLNMAGVENRHMMMLSIPHEQIPSSDYHQVPYVIQERHGQVMGDQPVMTQSSNVVYYSKTGSFGDDPRLYQSENISHQGHTQKPPIIAGDKIITPLADGSALVAPNMGKSADFIDTSYYTDLAGRPYLTEQVSSGFRRKSVNIQAQPEPIVHQQQKPVIASNQPLSQQPIYHTITTSVGPSTIQKHGGPTLSDALNKRGYRVYDPYQHGPRLGMIFDE